MSSNTHNPDRGDHDEAVNADGIDADKTASNVANDQTIDISQVVAQDNVSDISSANTIEVSDVAALGVGEIDAKALDAVATVMSSRQIDRTISSAELTGKDASIWANVTKQSLPGSATAAGSKNLLPRVDVRSIADTRLNLRTRQLLPQDSAPELTVDADYRLVRLLGKGGMGNVYVARQGSLDRLVALKVIKPIEGDKRVQLSRKGILEKTERQRRSQFISEAVVTGDLEHPNIVPIHDIAVSEDNTLFYSMKRVSGTPWSKVIDEKSRDENLEILLKVCDAIGFAHTRGIVHRDIKPENIMLGDFGIVMVMDWGLALAKPGFEKIDSIYPATGLGGSPAYMAPEMATGPIDAIGPASDIYLLGATLFQIITRNAPHVAPNITECLRAVAANKIREVQPQHEGELLDIALKAMASKPVDRYPDVVSLQNAVRQYRSHSESIALAAKATESLGLAKQTGAYSDFARAMFGFEEAIALWDGNVRGKAGLEEARYQYADAAYRNGDFDLGLSLLDNDRANHHNLITKITNAQRERLSRQARLKTLRLGVAALLAFIMVGGSVAIYAINDRANAAFKARQLAEANEQQATINFELARKNEQDALQNLELARRNFEAAELARKEALAAKGQAEKSELEAKDQTLIAVEAKSKAEQAEKDANVQRSLAEVNAVEAKLQESEAKKQQQEAEWLREKSDYESYVSRINLVKLRIDQNEFDDARRVLDELRTERGDAGLGWEWRWLSRQTKRSSAVLDTPGSPIDLAVAPSGQSIVVVLEDGTVRRAEITGPAGLRWLTEESLDSGAIATAVAVSADSSAIAIANALGEIEIFDGDSHHRLKVCRGHEGNIRSLAFARSGLLVSGSDDRTARLWDLRLGTDEAVKQLAVCWNLGPVGDVAVAKVADDYRIVVAVAESSSGHVGIWNVQADTNGSDWNAVSGGLYREHGKPVTALDISHDGGLVVSGDTSGKTLVWNPDDVKPIDYRLAIAKAVQQNSDDKIIDRSGTRDKQPTLGRPLVRIIKEKPASLIAHRGAVRSISIDPDGRTVLTTSDDYTIGLWDTVSLQPLDLLRGHGGWVADAKFGGPDSRQVISISSDRSMRLWELRGSVAGDRERIEPSDPSFTAIVRSNEGNDDKLESRLLHGDAVTSVRFDPTGNRILTASRDETSKVLGFDKRSQSLLPESITFDDSQKTFQEGSSFAALAIAIDPARQRLYVGSADSTIRVWGWQNTTEIGRIESTGLNETLTITPNGQFIITGSSDPAISCVLWEVASGKEFGISKVREFRGHAQATTCFAISNDGSRVFTGDRGGIGILWNAKTGEMIGDRFEQLRGYRLNDVAFSSDGSRLIIAADDFQVSELSIDDRKILSRFSHDGPVVKMQLSASQQFALTVSQRPLQNGVATRATLWDRTNGKKRELDSAVLESLKDLKSSAQPTPNDSYRLGRIVSASFGHQGSTIAIGVLDPKQRAMVRILNVKSIDDVRSVDGFRLPQEIGQLSTATPMPSGQMLSLNGDSAFWWDFATQQQVRSFRTNGSLAQASFSSDGQYAVTTSQGVKIWNVDSGKALLKLELPHAGPVFAAEFSPAVGDTVFATAGNDGVVKLWKWDVDRIQADEIRTWQLAGSPTAVRRLRFSSDGKKLAAVGDGGLIRVLYVDHDEVIKLDMTGKDANQPNAEDVLAAAWSRDGKWLATGGTDAIGRIWNVDVQRPFAAIITATSQMVGHADRIEDIIFLEDESQQIRILTASRDKSARVWDPRLDRSEPAAREILSLRGHALGVTGIDVSPNQQTVVTSGADGKIVLWPADEL